jgi:hypothetical protein
MLHKRPRGLPAAGTEVYPILIVGNGVFDVNARAEISLQAVTNSTTLPLSSGNNNLVAPFGEAAAFFYVRADQ